MRTAVGLLAIVGLTTAVAAAPSARALDDPAAASTLLRNRDFRIAFIRGSYPHGLSISVTTLRGRERTLLRARGDIRRHAWARNGTALIFETGRVPFHFELTHSGEVRPFDDFDLCLSSPDPARDGTLIRCSVDGGYTLHVPGRDDVFVPDIEENVAACCPALSRDGKLLASVRSAEVDPEPFSVGIAGTRCARCGGSTASPHELWAKRDLSWSPDGKRLAFSAFRNLDPFWRSLTNVLHGANQAVIVVDAHAHVVTQIPNAAHPTWSADGEHIAFDSNRTGRRQIYVANADGTHIRQLTHGRRAAWSPSWR